MKVEIIECDNCSKITRDIFAEKDWITLETNKADVTLSTTAGRTEARTAKGGLYYQLRTMHFCGIKCFLEYFKKLLDKKLNNLKKE